MNLVQNAVDFIKPTYHDCHMCQVSPFLGAHLIVPYISSFWSSQCCFMVVCLLVLTQVLKLESK